MKRSEKYFEKLSRIYCWDKEQIKRYGEYCKFEGQLFILRISETSLDESKPIEKRLKEMAKEDNL